MLSHLNHSINSVDLSDHIRMHLERKKTNIVYKLDKKKSIKKDETSESPTGGRSSTKKSPTHSPSDPRTSLSPVQSHDSLKKPLQIRNL
mmetsp:Transcript_37429/g.57341  ORF Transcript_37429/g.57341 Transcript_37429/m.57341 type:complete len:89 (+) Transcript_37429:3982-4248(+)